MALGVVQDMVIYLHRHYILVEDSDSKTIKHILHISISPRQKIKHNNKTDNAWSGAGGANYGRGVRGKSLRR